MKALRYLIIVLCAFALPMAASAAKPGSPLKFESTAYDFGNISDSHAPVVHEYSFVNTSDEAVAVLSVSTGCGCTKPEYPVKPLKPGEKGIIKITFLPKGQRGDINKDIKVRYRAASARSSKRASLRLTGTVTPGAN